MDSWAVAGDSGASVATYREGHLTAQEVERELDRRAIQEQAGNLQGQLTEYRRAAETLAVRRILSTNDEGDEQTSEQAEAEDRLRHQAVLWHYFRHVAEVPQIEESDIEAYYLDHRDSLSQSAQRSVWHLFRRDVDGQGPAETAKFLVSLRQRMLAGETFRQLALEYSQSETRLLEGRLGRISRGRLPPAIEEVVFALGEGEVSQPVVVPGGAALFHVSEVLESKQYSLEDVRDQVTRRLREMAISEQLALAVAETEVPSGGVVLNARELVEVMAEPNPEAVILRLGSLQVTQLQMQQQLDAAMARAGVGVTREQRLEEMYRRQVHRRLLFLELSQRDDWSQADRQMLDERVERGIRRWRSERLIEDRMRQLAAADPEALRAFYEDNAHRFQSSLALRLQTLSLPVEADAAEKMVALDRVRDALVVGEISFDEAARRLGASRVDQGWVDFETLTQSETKLRTYLLTLGRREGFTVPFQLGGRLNLIWVEDWREPQVLAYEDAEEAIQQQYLERNQQLLYKEVASKVLRDADFRFHEEVVRRLLIPGGDGSADS
ncbi:MAG: peptidyl-prolyl cis-trans isomerase [Deltaproteobacteria bacterium]|nr:peptidyl-prolyl cis-trans isomerase [Deltaproteobacteria bacterium]